MSVMENMTVSIDDSPTVMDKSYLTSLLVILLTDLLTDPSSLNQPKREKGP